jgi:protein subunit release factor B
MVVTKHDGFINRNCDIAEEKKTSNMLTPEKENALKERLKKLDVHEEDLVEKFILGSGKGGQKINKTSSCVYLKHLPTNIEIKCQQDRSREMNRFYARRALCERLEKLLFNALSEKQQAQAKLRRQKRRRSRRSKQKSVEGKRALSQTKTLRKEVRHEG